jgi:hypothetical protein
MRLPWLDTAHVGQALPHYHVSVKLIARGVVFQYADFLRQPIGQGIVVIFMQIASVVR